CERHGVRFRFDSNVQNITPLSAGGLRVVSTMADQEQVDEFDQVVICAGVASRGFASILGDHVNVYPVKGYSISVYLDDEES
ncbi:FAD-dependent oxidoreductase, partial [Priestia sp. SIMBA_032]|uniref:FAD-dependent oxidoreductase n=1 Tax=Priestia sp. SIMBA_032 TaxID=3085775 RepID=UPI00397B20EF